MSVRARYGGAPGSAAGLKNLKTALRELVILRNALVLAETSEAGKPATG